MFIDFAANHRLAPPAERNVLGAEEVEPYISLRWSEEIHGVEGFYKHSVSLGLGDLVGTRNEDATLSAPLVDTPAVVVIMAFCVSAAKMCYSQ